jgi:hypothetical protein
MINIALHFSALKNQIHQHNISELTNKSMTVLTDYHMKEGVGISVLAPVGHVSQASA